MSVPWLHAPGLPLAAGSEVELDADEARHAAGSRRLRSGDEVVLFDGRGLVAHARLVESRGAGMRAQVESSLMHAPPSPRIEIASAVPKGDRLATLIESIAPLAVAAWIPLECRHSVVALTPALAARAQRVCAAACKQSRQPFIPVVERPRTVAACCDDARARSLRILVAHPGTAEPSSAAAPATAPGTAPGACAQGTIVLIGPEGGFDAAEVADARARGALPVALGSAVLRIELAAACAAALLRIAPLAP